MVVNFFFWGSVSMELLKTIRIIFVLLFSLIAVVLIIFAITTDNEIMLYAFFATIGVITVGLIVISCLLSMRENKLSIITVRAKVVSKTSNVSGSGAIVSTSNYISFEFNGQRKNVLVDISLYNVLKENETGVLKYKEDGSEFIFVNFNPDV